MRFPVNALLLLNVGWLVITEEEKDNILLGRAFIFRVRSLAVPPKVHCYCSQDPRAHCFNLWTILSRRRKRDQQSSCSKCNVSVHHSGCYPRTLYSLDLMFLSWELLWNCFYPLSSFELRSICGSVALVCFSRSDTISSKFLIHWCHFWFPVL